MDEFLHKSYTRLINEIKSKVDLISDKQGKIDFLRISKAKFAKDNQNKVADIYLEQINDLIKNAETEFDEHVFIDRMKGLNSQKQTKFEEIIIGFNVELSFYESYIPIINAFKIESFENKKFDLLTEAIEDFKLGSMRGFNSNNLYEYSNLYLSAIEISKLRKYLLKKIQILKNTIQLCSDGINNNNALDIAELWFSKSNYYSKHLPQFTLDHSNENFKIDFCKGVLLEVAEFETNILIELDNPNDLSTKKIKLHKSGKPKAETKTAIECIEIEIPEQKKAFLQALKTEYKESTPRDFALLLFVLREMGIIDKLIKQKTIKEAFEICFGNKYGIQQNLDTHFRNFTTTDKAIQKEIEVIKTKIKQLKTDNQIV